MRMRILRRFLGEEGTVTIEAALMLPLFIVFFTMIADVAMIFYNQANITRLIQTANREYSVGQLATTTETEDYIETALAPLTGNAVATTSVSLEMITTTVRVPARDLIAVGLLTPLLNFDLLIQSEQVGEF